MTILFFGGAMAAISIMSTTREERLKARARAAPVLRWLWIPTIIIWSVLLIGVAF